MEHVKTRMNTGRLGSTALTRYAFGTPDSSSDIGRSGLSPLNPLDKDTWGSISWVALKVESSEEFGKFPLESSEERLM